ILKCQLTPDQEQQILTAFDEFFESGDYVSVRASTVGRKLEESEDSVSNPFAGMSESFLYVQRNELIEKVKQCWASGFSQESLIYRHAQDMDLMGFGVA
ncbi:MAG: phosphoenolpyruvate synthase, partial [Phototrophicales bacterium]